MNSEALVLILKANLDHTKRATLMLRAMDIAYGKRNGDVVKETSFTRPGTGRSNAEGERCKTHRGQLRYHPSLIRETPLQSKHRFSGGVDLWSVSLISP